MFSFGFATDNPHNMKLVQNSSATEWTLEQALLSVGYAGSFPVVSLEQVYMKLYVKYGSNVAVYSKAETNALLNTKRNLISKGTLTIPNITNLQTELNARPASSSVYSKNK
jgi:hypothetical protein